MVADNVAYIWDNERDAPRKVVEKLRESPQVNFTEQACRALVNVAILDNGMTTFDKRTNL